MQTGGAFVMDDTAPVNQFRRSQRRHRRSHASRRKAERHCYSFRPPAGLLLDAMLDVDVGDALLSRMRAPSTMGKRMK
jgi:hypothetical protein